MNREMVFSRTRLVSKYFFLYLYSCFELLGRSIMMMPSLIIVSAMATFYFGTNYLTSDFLDTWNSVSFRDRVLLTKLFLYVIFLISLLLTLLERIISTNRQRIVVPNCQSPIHTKEKPQE